MESYYAGGDYEECRLLGSRYFFCLKMKATRFSETSVYSKPKRRHIPQDGILESYEYY
jgi:hypothetical protein